MALSQQQRDWLDAVWKRVISQNSNHPLFNAALNWLKDEFISAANSLRSPQPPALPSEETDAPQG